MSKQEVKTKVDLLKVGIDMHSDRGVISIVVTFLY